RGARQVNGESASRDHPRRHPARQADRLANGAPAGRDAAAAGLVLAVLAAAALNGAGSGLLPGPALLWAKSVVFAQSSAPYLFGKSSVGVEGDRLLLGHVSLVIASLRAQGRGDQLPCARLRAGVAARQIQRLAPHAVCLGRMAGEDVLAPQ